MRKPPNLIKSLIGVTVFLFYGCIVGAILYHYHIPAGTIPSVILSMVAVFLILATLQLIFNWFD